MRSSLLVLASLFLTDPDKLEMLFVLNSIWA